MFSLITLGYQIEESIYHIFIQEHGNDFYEMLLHHIATITLYGGMIFNNNINIGALIAWVHMIADVPGAITKLYSNTKLTYLTLSSFILCIVSWFWTRCVIIPWMTYTVFQGYYFKSQ